MTHNDEKLDKLVGCWVEVVFKSDGSIEQGQLSKAKGSYLLKTAEYDVYFYKSLVKKINRIG